MRWRMSQHTVHSFYLLKIPADTHIHSHPHIQYGVRSRSCRDKKFKFPGMIRACQFCAKRSVSFLTLDFLDLLSHYLDHAGDHMPSRLPPLLAEFSFWQQEESHRRAGPWFTGSVWASIFICVLEERQKSGIGKSQDAHSRLEYVPQQVAGAPGKKNECLSEDRCFNEKRATIRESPSPLKNHRVRGWEIALLVRCLLHKRTEFNNPNKKAGMVAHG